MARIAAVPPITVIPGITHTVFVDNAGTVDASCALIVNVPGANLLNLRSMNNTNQVTSINSRTIGTRLDLSRFSVFDYQMRRKAETLQYRKNQTGFSKKKQYSQISNIGGLYSEQVLTRIVNANCSVIDIDAVVRPPTNSGVHDYKYPGYYYDKSVPYLPSL
uniref:Uncharacterized protein n=1 Tax=viral metagenome TaxID=1070528 RepID=A0A6C0D1V4_9ZZZZ